MIGVEWSFLSVLSLVLLPVVTVLAAMPIVFLVITRSDRTLPGRKRMSFDGLAGVGVMAFLVTAVVLTALGVAASMYDLRFPLLALGIGVVMAPFVGLSMRREPCEQSGQEIEDPMLSN